MSFFSSKSQKGAYFVRCFVLTYTVIKAINWPMTRKSLNTIPN